MSRDDLSNVAASVRQQLLNRAREQDEEYQLLLERYVQERFLHPPKPSGVRPSGDARRFRRARPWP